MAKSTPLLCLAMIIVLGCGGQSFNPDLHGNDTDSGSTTDTDSMSGDTDSAANSVSQGEACTSSEMCEGDMVCASDGTCQVPGTQGTTQGGEACSDPEECALGLTCINGICNTIDTTMWTGADCELPSEDTPFEPYFDLSRSSGEFYRLPFPNDAALVNGKIDLSAHPNPGVIIEELGNPLEHYFTMIETELDGFGTTPMVYFRTTQQIDYESIVDMETVKIVNVDADSESFATVAWSGFSADTARSMYICYNWIGLRPSLGRPLDPNTTYAAILTTDLKDLDGTPLAQNSTFAMMLQVTAPSDSVLAAAWNAYEPLRNYIASEGIDPSTVAVASVFTTQNSVATIPKIREKVRSEPAPILQDDILTKDETNTAFVKYQGAVTVPFFQTGVRPFKNAPDGKIEYDENGLPVWVEDEPVKFALTVPVGDAPINGWPIFLYAHGTGGSETSFIDQGIAAILANTGAAVISLEQVQHGDRRGLSEEDAGLAENEPDRLFYNFLNPWSARDNNIQGAADYFQLVRFVEDFATVTGEPVLFDTEKIYFVGHSQGTQGQYIFAAHEPLVKGLILSGAGGYLVESLLGKTKPVNVASILSLILMESNITHRHPVLHLIQSALDQVDPINHSGAVYWNNFPGMTYPHRNVFMSFGIEDSYTPENTQIALAKSLQLDMDSVAGHEIESLDEIETYPFTESYWIGTDHITTIAVQYAPDGDYDGHFVLFNHQQALIQWPHFIQTMLSEEGVPELISGQ